MFTHNLDTLINKTNENYKNYSRRSFKKMIDTVIIHYTYLNFQESFEELTTGKVSAHFLIDKDGSVYYLVDIKNKAWHAGVSYWRGKEEINNNSIGIELVNAGQIIRHVDKKYCFEKIDSFTPAQYESLAKLISELKNESTIAIKDHNIIGHSDITAYNLRKIDPGIGFDWNKLKKLGHGIYFDTQFEDDPIIFKINSVSDKIGKIQKKLHEIGYKIDINNHFNQQTSNVMLAFNMHYNQHNCLKKDISKTNKITKFAEYGIWRHSADNILDKIHNEIYKQIKNN